MLNFIASPFQLAAQKYVEGNGLNPLLQNPGMVFHPITLYLGYIGFAVPFAYAMMALITKRAGDQWIKVTRRWTVVAWLFLTLGNLYGGQWSYVELGWGGFYMWDPVENASLMPWFTGTAFLHSVMIQERKNMLKVWNMALIIITYVLTVLGTFMVRTGILTSVHAFGNSSMGTYFLVYIGLTLAWSLYLLVDSSYLLSETREFESYVSRESSFLLNNLLLVGAAFATLWGTLFPLISEAIRNVKVTVSMPFYNQVVGPILLVMLFVMGICPIIVWQRSSLKNLRRNLLLPLLSGLVFGLAIRFTLENMGKETRYISVAQFRLLYNLEGYARKQMLPVYTGRQLEGDVGPGQKLQGEIAWEVPDKALGLRVAYDDNVLAKNMDGDLVNGPIAVVVPRRGDGQAVFAISDTSNS